MTLSTFSLLITFTILTAFPLPIIASPTPNAGAPQISETALPSLSINPTTISSYQSFFLSWRSSTTAHNPRLPVPQLPVPNLPDPDGRTKCNWQCSSPCPCALEPVPPEDITTASWDGKSVYSSSTVALLPSVTDVSTATFEPLRTVIVRVSATATAAISEHEKPILQPRDIDLNLNLDDTNITTDTTPGPDTTNSFYTLPLSGYHPAVLPLITTPHNSNTPLTILAYANTTLYSSFISSTLVSALNLTSTIRPSPSSPFTPEHNITSLLGFTTKDLGTVNIDVLAGRNDRLVRAWPFVVFQAPGTEAGGRNGLWTVDLWVGWSFLSQVEAVMLTGEYSGSREAGARDGMGVLVQRGFEVGSAADGVGTDGGDSERMVGEL